MHAPESVDQLSGHVAKRRPLNGLLAGRTTAGRSAQEDDLDQVTVGHPVAIR